jgi:hypothetical protein
MHGSIERDERATRPLEKIAAMNQPQLIQHVQQLQQQVAQIDQNLAQINQVLIYLHTCLESLIVLSELCADGRFGKRAKSLK